MIKNVKIRILAFFMALTLSFCVCSHEYYEVNALEWVAPVVGLDTALKAILGLLGISASVGLASQIDWSDLQDDCVQYQIQKGNDAVAVGRWWDKVISGGIDTASSCWSSFKEWVSNELLNNNTSIPITTITDAILTYYPNADLSNISSEMLNYNYKYCILNLSSNGDTVGFYFLDDSYTYEWSSTKYNLYFNNGNRYLSISGYPKISNPYSGTFISRSDPSFGYSYSSSVGFYNIDYPSDISKYYTLVFDGSSVPTDSEFDSAVSDIGVIGLAPDVATDLPYDGVIDIPWENVGATDTAIDDAFDDALDKVNTGTWTLDQYWTWVQNVTNVFAYDTTNNFLLPNDGDDEKADDKVQQNINRGAMVLYGLEKVFPFCIPWDIYAFVNLLVAEPVAPVIEYPIYNPVSGDDEIITIDFSVWESQVILMRYIQDFLLIIGLLLLARSLIGAGGSD